MRILLSIIIILMASDLQCHLEFGGGIKSRPASPWLPASLTECDTAAKSRQISYYSSL